MILKRRAKGIFVAANKNTANCTPVELKVPPRVRLPLALLGTNSSSFTVKKGDTVAVGQPISTYGSGIGVPLHATVSGTVEGIEKLRLATGYVVDSLVIASDGKQTVWEGVKPPEVPDAPSFLEAIRNSGLVGLGGAGFPTWVKLNASVDRLIINGSECEPYCTADHVTMRDYAADLAEGIAIVQSRLAIEKTIIGVKHPPQALLDAFSQIPNVEIQQLREFYPVGAEKMLILETTGRIVPGGKLPKDVGCMVLNVNTAVFIARYLRTGMPLVQKLVTVDGSAVRTPGLVIAPIGTPVEALFQAVGGFVQEPAKIISGGPMMGTALPDLEFPLLWNCGSLLALGAKEAVKPDSTACIRCGRCAQHCPMNLMAFEMTEAFARKDVDRLRQIGASLCMECGCCAYVCPAHRDLVTSHKLMKRFLATQPKKEEAKSC